MTAMQASLRILKHRALSNQGTSVVVAVVAITALALILRLLFLDNHSLWLDEVLSVQFAQLGWRELWDLLQAKEANSGAYYVLLHFWLNLGSSEWTIRLLSVIPAVAAVPVAYVLGARLFGTRVGLIAALLLAVNAYHIQYSQEARSYSLLVLLIMLSSLFWVRSIEHPSWRNWAGYALFAVLAVYSHFFGALILIAHLSSLMFLPRSDLPWRRLVASGVVIGALLAPLAIFMFTHTGRVIPNAEPSIQDFHRFSLNLAGSARGVEEAGGTLLVVYLITCVAALVIAGRTLWSRRASVESWRYGFLVTWLVIPVIMALGISIIKPVFVHRFLIVCLPALALVAAVGLSQVGPRWPRQLPWISAVFLIALVGLATKGVFTYYTDFEKEDLRGAASLVASNWLAGDGLLFYMPLTETTFSYYVPMSEAGATTINSMIPSNRWARFLAKSPEQNAIVGYLPDHYDRTWLTLSRTSGSKRRTIRNELQAALESQYSFQNTWRFNGNVNVVLYSHENLSSLGKRPENASEVEVLCRDRPANIVGTSGDDVLTGTPGDDVIHGRGGDDTIYGMGGNDVICGGNGADIIYGGEGNDILRGNKGNDIINGGPGNDKLFGLDGDDQVFGDDGQDMLEGGLGNDKLDGGPGTDVCRGGAGANTLTECENPSPR